jgi:hypothetical protein
MMFRSFLLLSAALVWLSPSSVNGQVKPPVSPLELTAEITSQNYCTASSVAAQMNLKVRYRNVGNKADSLPGSHLFYQTRIRSAANALQAMKFCF